MFTLLLAGVLIILGPWSVQPTAAASPADKALATALFKEGRALMSSGRITEACKKLEESQNLDPSGGTILNLALCDEQDGRLARAWSEFNEAASFARKDARPDREQVATEHIHAIEPRLSKLTIVVPEVSRANGIRIERDGTELGEATWSMAMPVDGGEHVVKATAPGRTPFATTVVMAKEGDQQTVEIPALADVPVAAAPPAPAPVIVAAVPELAPVANLQAGREPPPTSMRRPWAWALGAASVTQLGVAAYFGLRAFDKHGQSNDECPMERCTPTGVTRNDQAGTAADVSTVLTIGGLVAAAASAYLFVTSSKASPSSESARAVATAPSLTVSEGGATLGFHGRF